MKENELWIIIVVLTLALEPSGTYEAQHCQVMSVDVKEELCTFKSNITHVQFPNFLGMETQQEAIDGLKGYELLLKSEQHCSNSLAFFLCHTYLPICNPEDENTIIKPCRAECEMSRFNCSSLMVHYSYPWPEILSCEKFDWFTERDPSNPAGISKVCAGNPRYTKENFFIEFPEVINGTYNHYNPDKTDKVTTPDPKDFRYNMSNCDLIGLENSDKTFNDYNCGLKCHSSYYGPRGNINILKHWILVWAGLCLIATLFTVMTFIFDQQRFRYPERAIIFSAVCYCFISVGFVLGYFFNDSIVCENSKDGRSVMRQGSSEDGPYLCFFQSFLIYYFMLASFLWWVILNLTWFLAAGLKWGHEAIALKAKFFHAVAWVLPGILFLVICIREEIDGDRLANICFVGNFKTGSLQYYVIVPLAVFYLCGMTFLGLGMFSMCNVRSELHNTGKKTDKLETLMIRIGMFSVLYSIPATILIACFLYERFQRPKWEVAYVSHCHSYSNPKKCDSAEFVADANLLTFNLIKYLMMLVTGLSTGFWVLLSFKTASNWARLLKCGFGKKGSETAV